MITYIARALGATTVHRARAGALFPGWSFGFEVFTRVLKIRARALAGMNLSARRADQDRAGDREARRFRHKVDRSKQTLAGIEGAWVRAYVPEGVDLRDPGISPLFGDLRGLPPLWVEVGTAEMLLDQVRAFAARAREQGGAELFYRELPGMVHNSFLLAAYFPQCKAAVDQLVAWLKRDGEATRV